MQGPKALILVTRRNTPLRTTCAFKQLLTRRRRIEASSIEMMEAGRKGGASGVLLFEEY